MSYEFGCSCGRHRGAASGTPQSVTYCHCQDCRKESGAPFFVWVGYENGALEWPDRLVGRTTKSGVTRLRCPDCGSTLAFSDEGLPNRTYIPLGAFDDPNAFEPTEHAYWPERVAWLSVADDLPKRDATTQPRVTTQ